MPGITDADACLLCSRNPFIGSRHSPLAIHYSSSSLNSDTASAAESLRIPKDASKGRSRPSSQVGIFVQLSSAPDTASTDTAPQGALFDHSTQKVSQHDQHLWPPSESRPVSVPLPGLTAGSCTPLQVGHCGPIDGQYSGMESISLPETLALPTLDSGLRAAGRERSGSASTAVSALSLDSTPSAIQGSNASSVGDDSTAVRQLQARWARVDGGFAFSPAVRRASHLGTVHEADSPAAAHSMSMPAAASPSLLKLSVASESGAYGIQLRPLELTTAWATPSRARGDTEDSQDVAGSPMEASDAFPSDIQEGLSPHPDVVHIPRHNESSVDLKASLLDKSVLAFNQGKLTDEYDVGRAVGDGGYAVVKSATHRVSGRRRAVMFIRKRLLFTCEERSSVKREVDIHASIKHDNVVRMVQAFEDPTYAMLVVEWMPGGSLKRYLDRRALKIVPEVQVRIVVRQVLKALQYIHQHKIVHCDVKPENILLGVGAPESLGAASAPLASGSAASAVATIAPHTIVKLCDFGNARRSRDARYFKATGSVGLVPFSAMHGTMGYMAPEVLAQRHYSTPVDMWALGVLTYTMLSGTPPFKPYHSCQAKNAQFEGATWDRLSLEARDFCRCLLQRKPSRRATADQALQHAWLSAELE